jgi:hypothetical protein
MIDAQKLVGDIEHIVRKAACDLGSILAHIERTKPVNPLDVIEIEETEDDTHTFDSTFCKQARMVPAGAVSCANVTPDNAAI